jgi:hypothetical protein
MSPVNAGILRIDTVPVVILAASSAGISAATRAAPAVTKPLVLTVTFGYVPAVAPEFARVNEIAVVPEPVASPVTEID